MKNKKDKRMDGRGKKDKDTKMKKGRGKYNYVFRITAHSDECSIFSKAYILIHGTNECRHIP
jgi:hypothetical protein